jgi:hypothetical protein
MRLFHSICSPILASLLLLAACTGSGPDKSEWDMQLVLMLPYYDVNDVKIEGTASIGDNATPAFKSRFSASITPKRPLYVEAGIEQGVRLIRETVPMGSKTKIFGVAVSKKRGDGWSTDITFEELPTGKQRNELTGTNYVIGSAEADAAISAALVSKLAAEQRHLETLREAQLTPMERYSKAISWPTKIALFRNFLQEQKIKTIRYAIVGKWRGTAICKERNNEIIKFDMIVSDMDELQNFKAILNLNNTKNIEISGYIQSPIAFPSIEGETRLIFRSEELQFRKSYPFLENFHGSILWETQTISTTRGIGSCDVEIKK